MTDREIIEEFAATYWINPDLATRDIIRFLLSWSAVVALDPRVSEPAADLYNLGYNDALAGRPKVWEPKDTNDDPFETPDEEASLPPTPDQDPYQP